MDKVKILVACHKPAKVYQDEVYTPIQVGKALHPDLELGYITDATGDNISEKNGNYSELTAQYWAWKNLKDVVYVGLCHYRRYFNQQITTENIDTLFSHEVDIILIKPIVETFNIATRLMLWTSMEDYYIFLRCFQKVHPNEFNKALEFLGLNKFSPYNMFIMKKGIYDKFAEWEFAIFNEMEKHVKLSSYSRQRRLYGYLSEPLLSMFAYINGLSVKFDKVTEYPGKLSWQHWTLAGTISTTKKKIVFQLINNFKSHPAYPPEHMKFDAVRVGLKNDGIKI